MRLRSHDRAWFAAEPEQCRAGERIRRLPQVTSCGGRGAAAAPPSLRLAGIIGRYLADRGRLSCHSRQYRKAR
jgi:hypothetical protein